MFDDQRKREATKWNRWSGSGKKHNRRPFKSIFAHQIMVSVGTNTKKVVITKYNHTFWVSFFLISLFAWRVFSFCSFIVIIISATAAYFTRDLIQLFHDKNPFISLHFVMQFSLADPFPFHIHKFCLARTQNKTNRTKNTRRKTHFVFAEICRENKRNIKRWRNCCLFLFIKLWTEMS